MIGGIGRRADRSRSAYRPACAWCGSTATTGCLPGDASDSRIILEAFKPGTVPSRTQVVIDGDYDPNGRRTGSGPTATVPGTSGLY